MTKKYVAIVGSRNYNDYPLFCDNLQNTLQEWNLQSNDIIIVSGGAAGADNLAAKWANENNCQIIVFKPDWDKYGKFAGPKRNTLIIEQSDYCLAFPSKSGKGTQDSIKKAMKKKIPLKVVEID